MGYEAKIITDSISFNGVPLTTFQITFPRLALAEFNTHRDKSRNSASSRAIPVAKMIERVLADPFIPIYWGKNQKGMQAEQELNEQEQAAATFHWLEARDLAVAKATELLQIGVHKQITNRLLEPFMWHTVIVTATEWANFFALRDHKGALPEFRKIAAMMHELYDNRPKAEVLQPGQWHLPLLQPDELAVARAETRAEGQLHIIEQWALVSCARCARVSYLTHEGIRDPEEDLNLATRLQQSGHMSPFEHAACALSDHDVGVHRSNGRNFGNFREPWLQYRKTMPNEAVFVPQPDSE